MLTIYLLRHGEAESAIGAEIDDECSHLTPHGIYQSLAAGKFIKNLNVPIGKIYTSGVTRTIETAEHLGFNLRATHSPLLKERRMGRIKRSYSAGIPVSIIQEYCLGEKEYLLWSATDGESQLEVINRAVNFLLTAEIGNGDLIICHGYMIQALRSILWGFPSVSKSFDFISYSRNHVRNCQLYQITFEVENDFSFTEEKSYYFKDDKWIALDLPKHLNPHHK